VDQPAELVTAAQPIEVDHLGEWSLVAERRALPECPVRSMLVEMPDVRDEHVHHPDPFGAEDLVKVTGELAVAITNEEPRPDAVVVELHQQVPRLLCHPAAVRVVVIPAEWTRRVAGSTKNTT
jgi:hypothetical protein